MQGVTKAFDALGERLLYTEQELQKSQQIIQTQQAQIEELKARVPAEEPPA